jgi:hypothetical protein
MHMAEVVATALVIEPLFDRMLQTTPKKCPVKRGSGE